ncbi:hypothetical protein HY546_01355, partial [archaeon]|nr:hypothetical protein [archaeon]
WFDEKYWEEFRTVIAMVSRKEKKTKSRAGQKHTVETSTLYQQRLRDIPGRIEALRGAIQNRNICKVADIAMRDSNSLHAVCLDTLPPIFYLNDTSKEIVYAIHDFNENEIKAGYSFDAGPNAVIFTLEKHTDDIKKLLGEIEGIEDVIVSRVGSGPRTLEEEEALMDADGTVRSFRIDLKKHDIIVE